MSLGPSTLKYFRSFRLPMTGNEGVEASILLANQEGEYEAAKVVNFSLSGLALVIGKNVGADEQLKVKLTFKKVDYLFHATVIRSLYKNSECLLGLEFDQNDHFLSKRFLEKYILDLKNTVLKDHIGKLITEEALPNNLDFIHTLELSSSCLNELIPKRLSRRFFKYSLKDFCLAHEISYMRLETENEKMGIRPIEVNMSEHKKENENEWTYSYYNHEDKGRVNVTYSSLKAFDTNQVFEIDVLLKIFLRYKEDGLSLREAKFLVPAKARNHVFVGQGSAVNKLRKFISKTKYNCLPVGITGNEGDGKRLLAQIIHAESKRQDGPCAVIDGKDFTHGQEIQGLLTKAFSDCERGSVIISHYDLMDEEHRQVVRNYVKYQIEEREKRARLIVTLSPKGAEVFKNDFQIFLNNNEFLLTTIPSLKDRSEDTYELIHYFIKKYCDAWGYPTKVPTKEFVSEIQGHVDNSLIENTAKLEKLIVSSIEIQRANFVIDLNPVISELITHNEVKIPNREVHKELSSLVADEKELTAFIVRERFNHFQQDVLMTAKSLGVSRSFVESIIGVTDVKKTA